MKKDVKMIIGYCRVSTQYQAEEGYSIDSQKHMLEKYFALNNIYIYKIIVDEGKTGRNLDRPGIQKIIKLIKRNSVDSLYCTKIDRLTRDVGDLQKIVALLSKYKTTFYSTMDGNTLNTSMSFLASNITTLFAQAEVALISERTKNALIQKARNGEYPYSNAAFGISIDDDDKLYYNEKIQVVKDVYNYYVNQKETLSDVTQIINKKYSAKYNRKFGKNWCRNTLDKTIYRGYIEIETSSELERFYLIEPIFNVQLVDGLNTYERKIRYNTHQEYIFLNKIFINNQRAKHMTKYKKGKIYKYYYIKKICINETLIHKYIYSHLLKTDDYFEKLIEKKSLAIEKLFIESTITEVQFKRMREQLVSAEVQKLAVKRIEFTDKIPVKIVTY